MLSGAQRRRWREMTGEPLLLCHLFVIRLKSTHPTIFASVSSSSGATLTMAAKSTRFLFDLLPQFRQPFLARLVVNTVHVDYAALNRLDFEVAGSEQLTEERQALPAA